MNPLSVTVIGVSLLISGPAWWAAFVDETLSVEVAAQRWLLCLVAVWAALSLVARMSDRALETTKADRAASAAPDPGAGTPPDMGTARRLGDESPEPED